MKAGDLVKYKFDAQYRAVVCEDVPENTRKRVSIYVFYTDGVLQPGLWEITVSKLTNCFEVINAA